MIEVVYALFVFVLAKGTPELNIREIEKREYIEWELYQ
jgi:hypothetical protein